MASQSDDTPGRPPDDAASARALLRGLDDDGARLAERVVTPWWYHPALGAVVAVMTFTTALPTALGASAMALCVVGLVLLPVVYRRRYGLWISEPAGPASRREWRLLVGVLVVGLGSGYLLGMLGPGWVVVPAAVVFVLVLVIGRRYDAALRRDLAGTGRVP